MITNKIQYITKLSYHMVKVRLKNHTLTTQIMITIFILCSLFLCSHSSFPFSTFSMTDSNMGVQSSYIFALSSSLTIENLDIVITFPIEYSISQFAATAQCYYSTTGNPYQYIQSLKCDIEPDTQDNNLYLLGSLSMAVPSVSPNAPIYLAIKKILNPEVRVSSYFKVCLRKNGILLECDKQFGRGVFTELPTSSNSNQDIIIDPTAYVGQGTTYRFKGILSSSYLNQNIDELKVRVIFPQSFNSDYPLCSLAKFFPNGTAGAYQQTTTSILPATPYQLDCWVSKLSDFLGPNNEFVIKVQNMINPLGADIYSNLKIQVVYNPRKRPLQTINFLKTVQIITEDLEVSLKQSNYMKNSTNVYYFFINHETMLGKDSSISFEFPSSGWLIYSAFPVIGFTSPETFHFEIDNNLISVSNYGEASNEEQQIVGINLTSYHLSGYYDVSIQTKIEEALIGEWDGQMFLNETSGALNLLSVSSVQKEVKLPVDSTGPLEMRFFLNYELPPSEDVQNGTLELTIFPKIPKPDPDLKGVVKCFWAGYYEGSCSFDDSMADRTKVIVTSPPHDAYKYSQIPLIITTEGGTDVDNLGLTIDPLVQRYRFQCQFYLYNSSSIPSQVFYTTWIADAIEMSARITTRAVTHECDEQTHLLIDISSPELLSGLPKEFRVMIQFLNTDGSAWADSLGYEFDKIYQRYPCLVTGLVGENVYCDLYTYYQRKTPYSNLHINTDVSGPYIIAYGFDQNVADNTPFKIQIPKIKIGSVVGVDAKLRISILEQTPGEREPYVELYYAEITAFQTLAASSLTQSSIPSSQTPVFIQTLNQYNIQWNIDFPADTEYIIYEFTDKLPSLQNKNDVCMPANSQACTGFGLPANHMLQIPVSAVTAPHTMQTIIDYIKSMDYLTDTELDLPLKIRTFNGIGETLAKYSMDITYKASPITISQFAFVETQVYGGLEQWYEVSFDNTDTSLSSYPFIRLILDNNKADELSFVDPPQCQSSNILPYNQSELICVRQDSQTMRIHNLQTLANSGSYSIRIKMQTTQKTLHTGPISPTIDIQINHNNSVDSSIVSLKQNLALSTSPTPLLTPPEKFQIHNPQILNQYIKIGYIGPLYIQFESTTAGVYDIGIKLNDHHYNPGFWSTPTANNLDPMVCFVNEIRYACDPTNSPLIINVNQAEILSGVNQLRIDTEYIYPYNGIYYPNQAGMYLIQMSLDDGTTTNQISFYTYIHPPQFLNMQAGTICKDIGTESVYKVNLTVGNIKPNAYSDLSMYSRITIQFPTKVGTQNVFDWNLGGYDGKVHEEVGCYFHSDTGNIYVGYQLAQPLKCRLLPSLSTNEPARVEIINQASFATGDTLSVYIFKVFNPTLPFSSVQITAKIDHIQVGTGHIYPLYEQQYRVFLDPYSKVNDPQIIYTQADTTSTFFQSGKDVGDIGYMGLTATSISGTTPNPFYMIVKLPQYFQLFNPQLTASTDSLCPPNLEFCVSIPEINYFMVKSITQGNLFRPLVTYPQSISQQDSYFYSNIIEDGRFTGIRKHTISKDNRWKEIQGDGLILNFCKAAGLQDKIVKQKTRFELLISFTIDNFIPDSGSIEIGFPSTVTNVQPHCRSSVTTIGATYDLRGKAGNTGQVGCAVQNGNKWVITGFEEIPDGKTLTIKGIVDLPTVNGPIGGGHITTYADTHLTDIHSNGSRIDHLDVADFNLVVQDTFAMNINEDVFMTQRRVLRKNDVGEYRIVFESANPIKITDTITLKLAKNDIKGSSGGFSINAGKKVCQFINLETSQQIGCIVDSETETLVTFQEAVVYVIRPTSETLSANKKFEIRLTSQKYIEPSLPEGIQYPINEGSYKTQTIITVDGNQQTEHQYIEIYGTEFQELKITQHNYQAGFKNLIWVQFTPQTTIQATDQIILEFPTLSNDGTTPMFEEDLGLQQYKNGQYVPIDIFDSVLEDNQFMKCRIYHGDQTRAIPVRLVCGDLSTALTNADPLKFAFLFKNPPKLTLTGDPSQISLPIIIYSYDPFYFKKTNFNLVNAAVVVTNQPTQLNPLGYFSTTSNQYQYPNDNLQFAPIHNQALQVDDSYVLILNFPLRVNGRKIGACLPYGGGAALGDAYYHEKSQVIVCKATTQVPLAISPISQTTMISDFFTHWYRLADSQRKVQAIAAYHSTGTSQFITFGQLFPHLQPRYVFPTSATFTPALTSTLVVQPIHGHNTICQTDDYIFEVTLEPSSTETDLSYCRMISIHLPLTTVTDYTPVNSDCIEYLNSQIQVIRCDIEAEALYIEIVPGAHNNGKTLKVRTKDMAIVNPCQLYSTADVNQFIVYFYSWENITSASSRDLDYAYLTMDFRNIISNPLTYTQQEYPNGFFDSFYHFQWIHTPHERYFEEFPQFQTNQYSPFSFDIWFTATSPPPTPGILHTLTIYYGDSFSPKTQLSNFDLSYNKPICYLHNNRIQRCTIDYTNKKMEMQFDIPLPVDTPIHVYFSVLDPKQPHYNGFQYNTAPTQSDIAKVDVELLHNGGTIYRYETQPFAAKQSHQITPGDGHPERAIKFATIDWATNIADKLNVLDMTFHMARTDKITALQFIIPLTNQYNQKIYDTSLNNAFFGIKDGGQYPCGNNDPADAATGNPKCYIYNGDNNNLGHPTIITMINFEYTTQIKARLLINNPDVTTSWFSIRVKAFIGAADSKSTFGRQYVGSWNFFNLFMPVTGTYTTGTVSNDNSVVNKLKPTTTLWRQKTQWQLSGAGALVNMGGAQLPIRQGGYVILQVPIWMSTGHPFTDFSFCQTDFSSGNLQSDDMLILTSKQSNYKKAYFIKKWTGTGPWNIEYFKCKHYYLGFKTFYMVDQLTTEETQHQIVVNAYNPLRPGEVTINLLDLIKDRAILQIDLDTVMTSINTALNPFDWENDISYELDLELIYGSQPWSSASECYVTGGVLNTGGTMPTCHIISAHRYKIRNFNEILVNTHLSNYIIKIEIQITPITVSSLSIATLNAKLYASSEANTQTQQYIFYADGTYTRSFQYVGVFHPTDACSCNNLYGISTAHSAYSINQMDVEIQKFEMNAGNLQFRFEIKAPAGSNLDGLVQTSQNAFPHIRFTVEGYSFSCSPITQTITYVTTGGATLTTSSSGSCLGKSTIHFDFTSNVYSSWADMGTNFDGTARLIVDATFSYTPINGEEPYLRDWIAVRSSIVGQSWVVRTCTSGVCCQCFSCTFGCVCASNCIPSSTVRYKNYQVAYHDESTTISPDLKLANIFTLMPLAYNADLDTEFAFQIRQFFRQIGRNNVGKLLLIQLYSSNPPVSPSSFISYLNSTTPAKTEQQIQCRCITSATITFNLASVKSPNCYIREPQGTFSHFALTIDIDVTKAHSLRCFFPGWNNPPGTLSATAKLINEGSSYAPHINDKTKYGGIYQTDSNTITFVTTAPDIVTLDVSENPTIYSVSDNPVVRTSHSSSYQFIMTLSTSQLQPIVYIDFQKSGFIPDQSMCSDSSIFEYCRTYNTLRNIIVAKFKAPANTVFKITKGTTDLQFPKHKGFGTDYDVKVWMTRDSQTYYLYQDNLIRDQAWLLTTDITFQSEPQIATGTTVASITTNVILSFKLTGHLMKSYYQTGGKIVIQEDQGVLAGGERGCTAVSIDQPQENFDCIVTAAGTIQVTNRVYNYDHTDTGFIQVIVGIQNPTADITWTIKGYQFYFSSTNYGLQFSQDVVYQIIDHPGTQQLRSQIRMFPFVTRIYSTDYSPFRIGFKLSDNPPSLPDDVDYPNYNMILSKFDLFDVPDNFTDFLCTFRQFTQQPALNPQVIFPNSYRNLKQNTQYTPLYSYCAEINDTAISIEMPRVGPLNIDYYYELVIEPVGTVLPQTGFSNLADTQFRLLTEPDSCEYIGPWQYYDGHKFTLSSIYLVTERPQVDTALQLTFTMQFDSAYVYPEHYFQIHFKDINIDSIKTDYKYLGGEVPCTLSSNFVTAGRTNDPFCIVNHVHEIHEDIVIRVVQLGNLVAGTYKLSLDDFILPDLSTLYQQSNPFTVCLRFHRQLGTIKYYQRCFGELFVIDGEINIAAMGIESGTFVDPVSSTHGVPINGQLNHNYPITTPSTSTVSQKAMVRVKGGYSATSPPLGFGGYTQLWRNQKINLYILEQPGGKTINDPSSIIVSNLINPHPYQKQQYEFINTIETTYYDEYHPIKQIDYNQPLFTFFTMIDPPLVSLDNSYVTDIRNIITTGTRSIAVLTVKNSEVAGDLETRLNDLFEITFDSADVSQVEDCWVATVTPNLAYSKDCRCQTAADKVLLYNFYSSQVAVDLKVYVQLRTVSTDIDVDLTIRLYSDNGEIQYQKPYQFTTMSTQINPSVAPFPHLSFTENVYTPYYFEQMIVPLTISQSVNYLYLSMYLPDHMTEILTRFNIQLPPTISPIAGDSRQICEWLKVSKYGRQYFTGVFSECKIETSKLIVYGPFGDIPAYDGADRIPYLLKIRQLDVIHTLYNMPTTSAPEQILFQFNNTGNMQYDTFIFHPYEHFSALKFWPYSLNVDQLTTYHIQFTPTASISGIQTILQLSIDTRNMDDDLGMENLFKNYGIDMENETRKEFNNYNIKHDIIDNLWKNGDPYSCYTNSANYFPEQTSVHMSSLNSHKIKITHVLQPSYPTSQFIWKIPLLLNPAALDTTFRMNLTLYTYQTNADFYQKQLFYEIINQHVTIADNAAPLTYNIKQQNSIQSLIAKIDIQITPLADAPTINEIVQLKLDNQVAGLIDIPDLIDNVPANLQFDFYFFPRINMLLGHKVSNTATSTIEITIDQVTEVTNKYPDYIGYDWVKYHSPNYQTVKQAGPSHKLLEHCVISSVVNFDEIHGNSWTTHSQFLLNFQFTNINCMIPKHSTMVVDFSDNNLYETILKSPCYITFRQSSCLASPRGIQITFFEDLPLSTTVIIQTYMKAIGTPTQSVVMTGFIFGIPGQQFTKIIEFTNIGQLNVTTNNIIDVPEFQHIMVQYLYENTQMDIRGTLIPQTGYSEMNIKYDFPGVVAAYQRMIMRANDTSPYQFDPEAELDWMRKIELNKLIDEGDYKVPSNGLLDYTIQNGEQYTFIIETTDEPSGLLNDFTVGPVGDYYLFEYETIYEIAFDQVYPIPIAEALTVINPLKQVSEQTAIGLQFTVTQHDVVPGNRITIQLDTVNLMYDMFRESSKHPIQCIQKVVGIVSTEPVLVCQVTQRPTPTNPDQALIITVYPKLTITQGTQIQIWLSPMFNPPVSDMVTGVTVRVDKNCNGERRCQIYEARGYYRTINTLISDPDLTGTFTPADKEVLLEGIDHTFDIELETYQTIFIKYPENYQDIMPLQCASGGTYCLIFPTQRRVLSINDPAVSINQIVLSSMNNGIYLQPLLKKLDLVGITSTHIKRYDIQHEPLHTRKRIPRLPAPNTMTITPTQTPNYFLRNYMNTATIEIYGLYSTTHINCFYINAPIQIVTWDPLYCNATIFSPTTDTYPTRLLCSHINDTTIQLLIPEGVQQNYVIDVTDQYVITVHAKFFIAQFPPGEGILYVTQHNDSGTFNAYGSYSDEHHDEPYYITEASTVIEISEHRVPILGDANFNTESFTQRLANINQQTTFELLIDPWTTDPIKRIQIVIPEQFNYPPTDTHDSCQLISTFTDDLDKCYEIRRNNKTILSVEFDSSIAYDNSPRILKLGSLDQELWFTAPQQPGSWYNFTVLLYDQNGKLLEAQTTKNSSNIGGMDLHLPDITVENGRDSQTNQVVDITFITGPLDIRKGYSAGLSYGQSYTEIRIGFQNLGAYDKALGLGLNHGDYVGCVFSNDNYVDQKQEVACKLDIGFNFNDEPFISITGYEQIMPHSTIKISISNILNLPTSTRNTVSIAVILKKMGYYQQAFLYNPTKKVLLSTTALSTVAPTDISIAYNNSRTVGQNTTIIFQITPSSQVNSYYLLKFPKDGLNDEFAIFRPSCTNAKVQVFYRSDIVRITPNSLQAALQYRQYQLEFFPTPQYAFDPIDWNISVEAYNDLKQVNSILYTIPGFQVSSCQFVFGLLEISSPYIHDSDVQYLFQFIVNTTTSYQDQLTVGITFPQSYGDLRLKNLQCSINSNATCKFTRSNALQIHGIKQTGQLKHLLTIKGLTNPETLSNSFIITSYIGENIDDIICQGQSDLNLYQIQKQVCSLQVDPSHQTHNFLAIYTFNIQCTNVFRNQSQALIKLPQNYIYTNEQLVACWGADRQNILENFCQIQYINGSHYIIAKNIVIEKNQAYFQINVELTNPSLTGTYQFDAFFYVNDFMYVTTNQANVQIYHGTPASISSVEIINLPKQSGTPGVYFIRIPSESIGQSLQIYFPSEFDLDEGLMVQKFVSNQSDWASTMNYEDTEKLSGTTLNSSISVYNNLSQGLFIEQTDSPVKDNQTGAWTYLMIKTIANPAYQSQQNFIINSYSHVETNPSELLLTAQLQKPLNYTLNPPAEDAYQTNISVTDNDILQLSTYTLSYKLETSMVTNHTQFYINPPYQGAIYAMKSLNCCLVINTSYTYCNQCVIFDGIFEFIIEEADIIINAGQSFDIVMHQLYNPPNATDCSNLGHYELSYFELVIMRNNKDVLYKSSSPKNMDEAPCVSYRALRGDIIPELPDILYAGLIHNFSISLSEPTKLLEVKISCTQSTVTFQPNTFYFPNYQTTNLSGIIKVSSLALNNQEAYINLTHFQAGEYELFRPNLPHKVKILNNKSATIKIQEIRAESVGYNIEVPIQLSLASSVDLTVELTVQNPHPDLLFENLQVLIPAGQKSGTIRFNYTGQTVPPTTNISLALKSQYPISHSLTSQQIYLYFEPSPKYQTLPPIMDAYVMNQYQNNSDHIGKKIYNAFNSSFLIYDELLPFITQHEDEFVGSTSAKILVHTRDQCSVAYIVREWGSHQTGKPNSSQELRSLDSAAHLKTIKNSSMIVNPYTYVNLTGLQQQTTYYIYLMAYSTMGNSLNITTHQITTKILSPAAKFKLITTQVLTDKVDIVKKLSEILMIDPFRIKVITSEKLVNETYINPDIQNPVYYEQQIAISPSTTNDQINAKDVIMQRLVESEFGRKRLKELIPSWIGSFQLNEIREINSRKPILAKLPQAVRISYYNATFSVKMWQDAIVHAILIETKERTENTLKYTKEKIVGHKVTPASSEPNSKQISKGLTAHNQKASKYTRVMTPSNGEAVVFFDMLRPGRKYLVYFAGTSAQIFEPTLYTENNQVTKLEFYTLWNPNLRNEEKLFLSEIKDEAPEMYEALKSFYDNQKNKESKMKQIRQ